MSAEVAVIVCSRNRADQLSRMLESLRNIETHREWELIVVDSDSTDHTAHVVAAFATSFPRAVRIVCAPVPGLGLARNLGAAATTAPVVLFTDDDCYPAPEWIDQMSRCLEESTSFGAVGGRIVLHDARDFPITIQLRTDAVDFPPGSVLVAGVLQGANFGFRRSALMQVGAFDNRMGAGTPFACEDIDVLARISAAGWTVGYDPRPVVAHHHGRRTQEEATRLMHTYDVGRGAFYCKMLVSSPLRFRYAWHWLRSLRYSDAAVWAREVVGALRFASVLLRRESARTAR
jgi:GT2 family glycosyltransferase